MYGRASRRIPLDHDGSCGCIATVGDYWSPLRNFPQSHHVIGFLGWKRESLWVDCSDSEGVDGEWRQPSDFIVGPVIRSLDIAWGISPVSILSYSHSYQVVEDGVVEVIIKRWRPGKVSRSRCESSYQWTSWRIGDICETREGKMYRQSLNVVIGESRNSLRDIKSHHERWEKTFRDLCRLPLSHS